MTHDDHDRTDETTGSGFEGLLGGTDARPGDDAQPTAVFFRPAPARPAAHRSGTTGGTHRATPPTARRRLGGRPAGWTLSARAVGATTAAGAVLLLASVGSGAVSLTGASSDSMLAVVAPGVASALGLPPAGEPDRGADPGPGRQPARATVSSSPAGPSADTSADPSRTTPATPSAGAEATDGATSGDDRSVREVPVVRVPVPVSTPTTAGAPVDDTGSTGELPVAATAPTPEPALPEVTEPVPTTTPVTTGPAPTDPVTTEPAVTTEPPVTTEPVVTTEPAVTTEPPVTTGPVVTTEPQVTTPQDTNPSAGESSAPATPTTDPAAEVTDPSTDHAGLLVALTLGGIGLGTAGRHAVRRGRHRAGPSTSDR